MIERLQTLRKEQNLSQQDLAKYLKIHQTTYSDYELGYLNIPTETLCRLAEFYQTSVDYLLGITDERKPHPRKKK